MCICSDGHDIGGAVASGMCAAVSHAPPESKGSGSPSDLLMCWVQMLAKPGPWGRAHAVAHIKKLDVGSADVSFERIVPLSLDVGLRGVTVSVAGRRLHSLPHCMPQQLLTARPMVVAGCSVSLACDVFPEVFSCQQCWLLLCPSQVLVVSHLLRRWRLWLVHRCRCRGSTCFCHNSGCQWVVDTCPPADSQAHPSVPGVPGGSLP
jgi:hypothetical protein